MKSHTYIFAIGGGLARLTRVPEAHSEMPCEDGSRPVVAGQLLT
jgi:hypothetical protein